ncbi:aldehyde dehydrogenase (NADP(+)) [Streptomyces hebeiensis]
MPLTGAMFLGAERRTGTGPALAAADPRTDTPLEPAYGSATPDDIAHACVLAQRAARSYGATSPERRATFLERIADRVEALGGELINRAVAETGLATGRVTAERDRAAAQLRIFAAEVRDGGWAEVRIDRALRHRSPEPRPDLRERHLALGPVAVFGAAESPIARSVAGEATTAALAAGCPVVVRPPSSHLGTAELLGSAVAAAVRHSELPEGVFSLVFGSGAETGRALVTDPRIRAVSFTGSRAGGAALLRTAAARPEPIPVYAEMTSLNPVFLLPGALRERSAELAEAFTRELTRDAGQFRTAPGLLVAADGLELAEFLVAARTALTACTGATMLTRGVHAAYERATAALAAVEDVREVAAGRPGEGANTCVARLFTVPAGRFLAEPALRDGVFGAVATVVTCRDTEQLVEVAHALQGQLTATVHHGTGDRDTARALLPLLEGKAGRVVYDGWPTGVEVGYATVHSGPFPAASDARTTAIGTLAVRRYLRPVCYQDVPAELLPAALHDDNPYGLRRRLDGAREQR